MVTYEKGGGKERRKDWENFYFIISIISEIFTVGMYCSYVI